MLDIKFTDCLQEQGLVIELEQNEGDKKAVEFSGPHNNVFGSGKSVMLQAK